jgi:hypothetical protein
MQYPEEDEPAEMMDVPPSRPLGQIPVTFDVPIPTMEQVAGEMARQLIEASGYRGVRALENMISEKLSAMIENIVTEKARPILEELLTKSFQPTDAFGNPTGATKTLHSMLGESITAWGAELVDNEGRPGKPDHYSRDRYKPRVDWALKQIVSHELTTAVNAEVTKIVGALKGQATAAIAKQIAEKISGMVIK